MAETFSAIRRGPGAFEQHVCLKRVLPAFSQDPKFVDQFQHEARLAAALRHSNIVGVVDFGDVRGEHYMALELVDGADLKEVLRSREARTLDPELVALIALDLAYALDYAHNAIVHGMAGVVHRDVSPSNVLISRQGQVKLADFGVAKAMSNAAATASNMLKGKIPYMAPEQMQGRRTDGRSDLFSLGVMLFEMLVGVRPYDGKHDVETMTRVLAGDRRELAPLAPHVSESLCNTVERLIEPDADKRIQSASELIDHLAPDVPKRRKRRELAGMVTQVSAARSRPPKGISRRASRTLTDPSYRSTRGGERPTKSMGERPIGERATPMVADLRSLQQTVPGTAAALIAQAAADPDLSPATLISQMMPKFQEHQEAQRALAPVNEEPRPTRPPVLFDTSARTDKKIDPPLVIATAHQPVSANEVEEYDEALDDHASTRVDEPISDIVKVDTGRSSQSMGARQRKTDPLAQKMVDPIPGVIRADAIKELHDETADAVTSIPKAEAAEPKTAEPKMAEPKTAEPKTAATKTAATKTKAGTEPPAPSATARTSRRRRKSREKTAAYVSQPPKLPKAAPKQTMQMFQLSSEARDRVADNVGVPDVEPPREQGPRVRTKSGQTWESGPPSSPAFTAEVDDAEAAASMAKSFDQTEPGTKSKTLPRPSASVEVDPKITAAAAASVVAAPAVKPSEPKPRVAALDQTTDRTDVVTHDDEGASWVPYILAAIVLLLGVYGLYSLMSGGESAQRGTTNGSSMRAGMTETNSGTRTASMSGTAAISTTAMSTTAMSPSTTAMDSTATDSTATDSTATDSVVRASGDPQRTTTLREGTGAATTSDSDATAMASTIASTMTSTVEAETSAMTAAETSEMSTDRSEMNELGSIRVTVVPWGRVWVDGRLRGRAPRSIRLGPGTHLVQVGYDRPMLDRTIRLRAGQRRSIELELPSR